MNWLCIFFFFSKFSIFFFFQILNLNCFPKTNKNLLIDNWLFKWAWFVWIQIEWQSISHISREIQVCSWTFAANFHSILWFLCNRPHLKAFLQQMSKLFELHMYTMGTQAYARRIGEIIDPDHSLFHHRILARDACGAALSKDLKRLFPGGGKLAVVNLYFHFFWKNNCKNCILLWIYVFK